MSEDTEEEGSKRNILLGYKRVEELAVGLTRVETKLDAVNKTLADDARRRDDHEVRIRAMELVIARNGGSTQSYSFIWHAIWPVAAVIISILAYMKG